MGFRFGTCVAMCLLALTAAAMPTAADFEKARPVVEAAAEGQPAEKVQALSAEAETEAGKYLLLEKAAAASAPSGGAASDHLYLVVDLASGPKARKYRVTYLKSARRRAGRRSTRRRSSSCAALSPARSSWVKIRRTSRTA